MISICLLNFLFCSCVVFLILLNCFSVFSCTSLNFLEMTILGKLGNYDGANCRFPSLSRSLENYCFPLVVLYSLNFSCLLKSCLAFFAFKEVVTPSTLCGPVSGEKYPLSPLLENLRFSKTFSMVCLLHICSLIRETIY